MLSVSPPLHQDFRSRQMLCSPGDGWRAYVPPPPPVLPSAFHFLAPLLLPEAYPAYSSTQSRSKPFQKRLQVLDKRLYGKLEKVLELPFEIVEKIFEECVFVGYGKDLLLVSNQFNQFVMPLFYQKITLRSQANLLSFIQTVEQNPNVGQFIRELHFEMQSLPWQEVKRLLEGLGKENCKKIKVFQIQIPASDLELINKTFQNFIFPNRFIWKTFPCWQFRPKTFFLQFFENWKFCLQDCVLENFNFNDDHQTLFDCLATLHNLKKISLRGRGSDYLSKEVLQGLVSLGEKKEFLIEIANCSMERQTVLQDQLDPSTLHRLSWI